MSDNLKLNNLNCQIQCHNSSQIIGFCIDEKCKEKNKFACQNCFFDIHSMHKLVKLDELNIFIQKRYKEYTNSLDEEQRVIEIYKNNEKIQEGKIEQFKKDIIKELEIKINSFIEELKKVYNDLISIKDRDFVNLKEYEEYFTGNAAPTQKPDLNKLSELCCNIYKETEKGDIEKEIGETPYNDNGISQPNVIKQKKSSLKKKLNIDNFNKLFDNFINEQFTTAKKYIKENILNIPENFFNCLEKFEWCRQTYSGYDFFYELSNNNKKGTKTVSNGTMTILRAKEKLKDNLQYNIRFRIGLKNGGDFDIGIGTDRVGESCWLRTKESICLSNTGVMNLDINMDNSIKLRDNDIVDLEINTEKGKKYFKGFINEKLICWLDFDLENVYIMAAIRNNYNFIEVLNYNISEL